MTKKKFLKDLEDFVKNYHDNGIINEKKKKKILNETDVWNKENLMDHLVNRIDELRLYEEPDFPFMYYLEGFMPSNNKKLDK
jgi:hypothetical protein